MLLSRHWYRTHERKSEIVPVVRKLAAILAADVVGYGLLMGADEEGTLTRLKAHRRSLVDRKLSEYRGRIVKTTGDGMLVEFASALDAVCCAVDIQRGMAEKNVHLSPDERIEFRVGVNIGDIIISHSGDVFGNSVNVAVRLENIAGGHLRVRPSEGGRRGKARCFVRGRW